MQEFIRVMKALSDPNRVKILKLLQEHPLCVCELQAALDIAQPTVSNHLKVLEEAGLVDYRKSGLWVYYHLSDRTRTPYAATLLGSLKHWLKDDPEILRLIGRLPEIRQRLSAGICLSDRSKSRATPAALAKCLSKSR